MQPNLGKLITVEDGFIWEKLCTMKTSHTLIKISLIPDLASSG